MFLFVHFQMYVFVWREEIEYELFVEKVPNIWREAGEKKETVLHIFDKQ